MSVMTTTRANVRAGTQTRSAVYVANEVIRSLLEIVGQRGLPLEQMQSRLEFYSDSFRLLVAGRWLESVTLEVFDPGSNRLVEKYELDLSYAPTAQGEESFATHVDKLRTELSRLAKLGPKLCYRVLIQRTEGSPDVPGWYPTVSRDDSHLQKTAAGKFIETLHCTVGLGLWTQGGNDQCK